MATSSFSKPSHLDAIVWDWNGTLMDDVGVSVRAINTVLTKRRMTPLTEEVYRQVFRFPVIDYYKAIGFDFAQESFEVVGREFINEYERTWRECPLQQGMADVLVRFQRAGIRQYILSAASSEMLGRLVAHYGIETYFSEIAGLDHIYASSKVGIGKDLFERAGLSPGRTLLVGDTAHDAEVAAALGCHVILIARGHECGSRLRKAGHRVADNHHDLLALVAERFP